MFSDMLFDAESEYLHYTFHRSIPTPRHNRKVPKVLMSSVKSSARNPILPHFAHGDYMLNFFFLGQIDVLVPWECTGTMHASYEFV